MPLPPSLSSSSSLSLSLPESESDSEEERRRDEAPLDDFLEWWDLGVPGGRDDLDFAERMELNLDGAFEFPFGVDAGAMSSASREGRTEGGGGGERRARLWVASI